MEKALSVLENFLSLLKEGQVLQMLRLELIHLLFDVLRSGLSDRLLKALIDDGPVDAIPHWVLVNFVNFLESLLVNHIPK